LVVLHPAAGAFVGLSQATLMDFDPERHEINMARWALAGSLGVVAGPLLLGATVGAGFGWRTTFIALTAAAMITLVFVWNSPSAVQVTTAPTRIPAALMHGARGALIALRRGEIRRWLALLELADLMLDVLHGFLGLYFVDVVG